MTWQWAELRRHHGRELFTLASIAALVLIPWLVALGAGIWFMAEQGWGWIWWIGTVLLLVLAFLLLRRTFRARPIIGSGPDPGAPRAEECARQTLRRRAEAFQAEVLPDPDSIPHLITGAFHDVAIAYSPNDPVALWRFTLPELLLMVEDFTHRLRDTVLVDFPVLKHVELSWAVNLIGLSGPTGKLLSLYQVLRWVDPSTALASELRGRVTAQAVSLFTDSAKAQLGVLLIEQAGETAIKLYSGAYRRRAEELLPTAPKPIPDKPDEPLTVLLAGRRNAGKSALLNALLGKARERVGLLTPLGKDCRAYELRSEGAGTLILIDCPGLDGEAKAKQAWLAQATQCDLVLWVAAANRADRAGDQRALTDLDALTESRDDRRRIPRILVLTHADQLDPPTEWAPPYDIEQGKRPKEEQMRDARQAACEALNIPSPQCALLAIRPDQPLWNADALQEAIHQVLPEARQKQLERGLAKDGWFQTAKDTGATIPTLIKKSLELAPKAFERILGKLARQVVGKGTGHAG